MLKQALSYPLFFLLAFIYLPLDQKKKKEKKKENRKHFVFSCVCLVGEMEKWRDEKLICLDEKKNEKMKNIVDINLLLYSHYLKYYIFIFNYITHKYKWI